MAYGLRHWHWRSCHKLF